MDVEELRTLAKSMGYNIIPIRKREKLLPCICGCKTRSHQTTYVKGVLYKTLRCNGCDREASGGSEAEAIHNWNEMMRSEQDGCRTYCRYTGKMCEFATEFGYCKITVCVKGLR